MSEVRSCKNNLAIWPSSCETVKLIPFVVGDRQGGATKDDCTKSSLPATHLRRKRPERSNLGWLNLAAMCFYWLTDPRFVYHRITCHNYIGAGTEFCIRKTILVTLMIEIDISQIEAELKKQMLIHERLELDRPYHTPLFKPFIAPLWELCAQAHFESPPRRFYSATTAQPFPAGPAALTLQPRRFT